MSLLLITNLQQKNVSLYTVSGGPCPQTAGTAAYWFKHSMFPKPSEPETCF